LEKEREKRERKREREMERKGRKRMEGMEKNTPSIHTRLVYSPCASSLAGIPPGGLGLSGLVHEEAHPTPSISKSF